MLPRPAFRMPLWLAVALAAGVYVTRAVVRGFDFRPDMPADAIVGVAFLLVLAIVAYVRWRTRADEAGELARQSSEPADPHSHSDDMRP